MRRTLAVLSVTGFLTRIAVAQHDHHAMQQGQPDAQMDHSMSMPKQMPMRGVLGDYPMTRESSGTAWEPEATPMEGIHFMSGAWMFMLHGNAYLIYDAQDFGSAGDRGGSKTISTNMFMLMGQRPLGPGTLGVRAMLSLEPATIGKTGYPLLFQTGETADNVTPLIDRQHPHDLFMELAATYSLPTAPGQSAFVYLGMPGEPALGPATFMHRFSGMDNPEAPITHHWLDSTHITFGVATVGYVWNQFKLEGSVFTGREPDELRWDFDPPKMDSQSVRLTWNPAREWSAQVSYGHINSPEQLEPDVDQDRLTASVSYSRPIGAHDFWATTLAWGQNDLDPGGTTNAFLLESTLKLANTHTFFGRYENVEKDELFEEGDALAGEVFRINKLSVGYIYDFPERNHVQVGIGGLGSVYLIPHALDDTYGDVPVSAMLFARIKF